MHRAVFSNGPYDVAICAAAVSDWYIKNISNKKIKKKDLSSPPQFSLEKNPDILEDLSKGAKRPNLVIGFAAETEELVKNAKEKLRSKGCDLIVANKINKDSTVFGSEHNEVSIITNTDTKHWDKMSKAKIGIKLGDLIAKHYA